MCNPSYNCLFGVFSYCTIKLYFKISRFYICFGLTLFNAVVPGEGTWGGEVGFGTQLPDGGGGGGLRDLRE